MTDQDRLVRLWNEASAFYQGEDVDESVGRHKVRYHAMARDMTHFAIKNGLNEEEPIYPSNLAYWWRNGRVTRRVARMFELFIAEKKAQQPGS